MGQLFKSVGFSFFSLLGGDGAVGGVPVLAFHSVDGSGTYLSTAPDHFRAEMERLAERGLAGVSVSHAAAHLREGDTSGKMVVLTFDDGLESFGEHAWPVLRDLGFGATLYVPVDCVGRDAHWFPEYGLPALRLHGWDELRRLRDEGLDIQSHGCRHPRLTRLDDAGLRDEVFRSRQVLERELGISVKHFCYPFGDYDGRVMEQVRACGYLTAVTTDPGYWQPGADPLAVRRLCLDWITVQDCAFAKRVIDACLDGSFPRYVKVRDRMRAMVGMKWEPPSGK